MRQVALLLVVGLVGVRMPGQAGATAYECQGHGGSSVFTDNPTGLPGCQLLSTAPAPASPDDPTFFPPTPSGGSTDVAEDPPVLGLDLPAEAAGAGDLPDRTSLRPDRAAGHDPENAPPGTVVAPSAQTCARGMNRLNPFGGGPCDPAASYAPMRAPSEEGLR
jgi:hypothetical protein